jgi:6-phosphofructokinase 1
MNAAVRAVVRTALARGREVYAVYEGYQGLVDGGDLLRKMDWAAVSGILHRGGTVIGTARCQRFRERDGRREAVYHLVQRGIDGLVVVGGDGSLTGAAVLRKDWESLLAELRDQGRISEEQSQRHSRLRIVGIVGSIDNDMCGTDMTVGADTALHRITEAVDAIGSTAASHQRSFVVEVMGRQCGYLALMSAIATGADWVLIPEHPPHVDDWEEVMCQRIRTGREAGRRKNIVIVAEGARDRHGKPISGAHVCQVLEERLGEDVRTTVLGHVQRGGAPTAFDRYLSTVLGHAAVDRLLAASPDEPPQLVGVHEDRVTHAPLEECVSQTRSIADLLEAGEYDRAMELRAPSFRDAYTTYRTLVRSRPHVRAQSDKCLRLAILHAGGPAPGMNTAVRAAVRLAISQGHIALGVRNGFRGLIDGEVEELDWMSVHGWASRGGAELGTNRIVPGGRDLYALAKKLEEHSIDGLLMIGGWAGYVAAHRLLMERDNFPAFNIPMVCVPATIDNNLPGSDLSVGCDTALNAIVLAVDRIKQSAVASRRCFVVEVMGRHCGFLALMSGLASGAERVYLHEEGVTLDDLREDISQLVEGFEAGKRLGLIIRNENAHALYTTAFMCALFQEEGGDLFDVRPAILGHLQQGGDPSPFDRIRATRLAVRAVEYLIEEAASEVPGAAFIGFQSGRLATTDLDLFPRLCNEKVQRPKQQWWMALRPIARLMARPNPPGV